MISSASDFGRDHGLIHEVILTGRKAGWGHAEWARLAHNEELMRQFGDVLRDRALVQPYEHCIDTDAPPFCGFAPSLKVSVTEHRGHGKFVWDATRVGLYLTEGQKKKCSLDEATMRASLSTQKVLNAAVLDYLLTHKYLIPESWKGNEVYFWGTIFDDGNGERFVRYISWWRGRWGVNAHFFYRHSWLFGPAAIFVD